MQAIAKMIRNTHRHPVNQALHCVGAPFYAIGAVMTIGYFAGMQTNLAIGAVMWLAAIAMFVVGHRIENNLRSMTPVLLFRLISRKAARYFVVQHVHFLRT
jgi:hypothetical protein